MQSIKTHLLSRVSWLLITCAGAFATGCSSNKKKALSFTTTPASTVVAGSGYSYQATAVGTASPIVYSLNVKPAGMSISSSGLVTWATTVADVGVHPVTLSATGGNRSGGQSWTITVQAASPVVAEAQTVSYGPWRDTLDSAGSVPRHLLESSAASGMRVVAFSWLDEFGRPDLGSSLDPEWRSWANPDTRAQFVVMIASVAGWLRPERILLAGPAEFDWLDGSAEQWSLWLEVVADVYEAVSQVSGTQVSIGPE